MFDDSDCHRTVTNTNTSTSAARTGRTSSTEEIGMARHYTEDRALQSNSPAGPTVQQDMKFHRVHWIVQRKAVLKYLEFYLQAIVKLRVKHETKYQN